MTTLTQTMAAKVEAAIERNQRAMVGADRKGLVEVVQMCCRHHWRLRRAADYLEGRLAR